MMRYSFLRWTIIQITRKKFCVYITRFKDELQVRMYDGDSFFYKHNSYPRGVIYHNDKALYREFFSSKGEAMVRCRQLAQLTKEALGKLIAAQGKAADQ